MDVPAYVIGSNIAVGIALLALLPVILKDFSAITLAAKDWGQQWKTLSANVKVSLFFFLLSFALTSFSSCTRDQRLIDEIHRGFSEVNGKLDNLHR